MIARKREMEECVRVRNNENRKENVESEREECENVQILGSWVGDRVDIRNRLRRGGWM